jgi:hypothetical protein
MIPKIGLLYHVLQGKHRTKENLSQNPSTYLLGNTEVSMPLDSNFLNPRVLGSCPRHYRILDQNQGKTEPLLSSFTGFIIIR